MIGHIEKNSSPMSNFYPKSSRITKLYQLFWTFYHNNFVYVHFIKISPQEQISSIF